MASTTPPVPVTTKQHALLLTMCVLGSALLLYFIQTRSITPRLARMDGEMRNGQHQLNQLRAQLTTRESMDLPTMRDAVQRAREKLRTVQIQGRSSDDQQFLDTTSLAQVAAFQAQISQCAAENKLFILSHNSINSTDAKLEELVLRELEVRGSFVSLLNFVEALGKLPYRIIIIKLEVELDPEHPGRLRSMLRYSV